ncbi:acetyl-CoA acetyltransferase [Altererythrobacter sp. MF3-039]|uniref:acetyl-CoA acetyltransferase n=1 Tax=Altererythrobacter sp. MF3-039 TaxID=3252901 RepID=UPI00390CD6F5
MNQDPERTPVIVGVGQINDRPDDPLKGLDSGGLMVAALKQADEDAGGGWLADADSLAIVSQLSFPHLNPLLESVAQGTGMSPEHAFQTAMPNGDSPILLLNQAANRIGAGEGTICCVVGAEALRTAGALAKAAAAKAGSDKPHNALRDAAHRVKKGYRQTYGLTVPVDVYPLYENAGRASYGQTVSEAQAESGAIWSGFSKVAADNPAAWIHQSRTAEEIVTPDGNNRPIAYPYTKLQVANSSVNQGAGFIVTSLAEARRRGLSDDRIIYVGMGAAAHESDDFLERDTFAASPSMEVSIKRAMKLNNVQTSDLDHVELYSCFPCVPKMARRIIDWPLEKPATVFGGLTFGGGPIGNYMSHAVASMVEKLRATGGQGLLFANGGYATHNHTILVSSDPIEAASFPQDYDFQAEANSARGPVPELDKSYSGPAEIETYTVHYRRDGTPRMGTIVARTPQGKRTLAMVPPDDIKTIAFLTNGEAEPVGTNGSVVMGSDEIAVWERAA